MLFVAQDISAQDAVQRYNEFLRKAREEYDNFRQKINEDYATFLSSPWQEVKPSITQPPVEPPTPPVPKIDETVREDLILKYNEVVRPDQTVPAPRPQPVDPPVVTPQATDAWLAFSYLGNRDRVRFSPRAQFGWYGGDEPSVAKSWREMSDSRLDATLSDCLALRDKYRLCDWAYLEMLNSVARQAFPRDEARATLLTAWLFCQSGYRIRLARAQQGTPVMLYASDNIIFGPFYNLDGQRYYPYGTENTMLYISNASFPREQTMSLTLNELPLAAKDMSAPRLRSSRKYPDLACSVSVNKNLIEFFNRYPNSKLNDNIMTRWANYANTPLSPEARESLYPVMQRAIKGLSEHEAVARILNWVQTGFEYKLDNEVWGHDRAFFPDETLYYPYADCEDRAILFTRLVRDLLGLDVLLVYYPGHLASAVRFPSEVPGDYILLSGARYTVCDPTFTDGAPIGRTAKGYDNATATVILLHPQQSKF